MEQSTVEMITQMVLQTLNKMEEKSNGYQVPVGVSARHIHLTQEHVEILFGEGYHLKLGVAAPIRESGNVAGSAPIAVVGPKGVIYLKEGCIIAMRHIHMSPADAMAAGVHDGDIVSVKADNERGTVFNQVKIRVSDSFTLEMHIDTDEANASKIKTGDKVTILS